MEIERVYECVNVTRQSCGNKENLLKMEIESLSSTLHGCDCSSGKQRKSPENGDWKCIKLSVEHDIHDIAGNKENLLKMEIESLSHPLLSHPLLETKKISWKWRLKDTLLILSHVAFTVETKKISWKWRLKDFYQFYHIFHFHHLRNKENLLKMEIERGRCEPACSFLRVQETKKISWKWRLKDV